MSRKRGNSMNTIGNVIWLLFGGLEMAIVTFFEGILLCLSIIFIPVGLQFFKVAKFFIWPMGKKVVTTSPSGLKSIINIVWLFVGGWGNALMYAFVGLLFCITIVGIPFGLQYFKLARFILTPLGHDFEADD